MSQASQSTTNVTKGKIKIETFTATFEHINVINIMTLYFTIKIFQIDANHHVPVFLLPIFE